MQGGVGLHYHREDDPDLLFHSPDPLLRVNETGCGVDAGPDILPHRLLNSNKQPFT